MRLLPLLLVIAFVTGPGIATTGLAASELAARLEQCAGIESAVERLDCYDRLAREAAQESRANDRKGPAQAKPEERQSVPAEPVVKERSRANQDVEVNTDKKKKLEWFGRDKPENPAAEVSHMDARIESVEKTPLGHHVMTLSNGQKWMENEPGRRSIAPQQDVTIRKHRWHFEMELDGQPNIAVRRVE